MPSSSRHGVTAGLASDVAGAIDAVNMENGLDGLGISHSLRHELRPNVAHEEHRGRRAGISAGCEKIEELGKASS